MILKFTRDHLLLFFDIWWIGFVALSYSGFNALYILTIVGFISIVLVPGTLTIGALRLSHLNVWMYISVAAAFSVLELILVGLFANLVLPYLGIERPLDTGPLLCVLTLLVGILASVNWVRMKGETISIELFKGWGPRDSILAFSPVLFVIMSVVGASVLNAGGSGAIILTMLIGIAIYSAVLLYYSRKVGAEVIPTALFFIGLSLLLMTSLRGYSIVGHDIQNEFRVFELAQSAGIWTIASYQDAYNACMSITILPTIFANVLALANPYVYKVLFQILFALVPTSVFLLARQYVSAPLAFMATLYFVSFPTFFTDMSFLNRQEIAFFFLALMFLIGLDDRVAYRMRQALFLLFGGGMILSHYSTTYTVVALLVFLLAARPLVVFLRRFMPRQLNHTTLAAVQTETLQTRPVIAWWVVGLLVGASFLWSSVFTETSSNSLYRVVTRTVEAMQSTFKEDVRSGDVLYSLFSWKQVDLLDLFEEYNEKALERVAAEPPTTYYPSSITDQYPTPIIKADVMPPTVLGRALAASGLVLETFNSTFRQMSAKLLQLFMLVGGLVILWRREWFYRIPRIEYVLMGIGSLIILSAIIVLPVLSVEYGLLRAFQQSLMFLGICIVIGSASLLYFLQERWRILFAGTLAIIFLLSSTGVFTQLIGGYDAQLHLNNAGRYYDLYYVHESELQAIEWLAGEVEKDAANGIETTIQGDHYALEAASALQEAYVISDIYPALVRRDAYVFLGVSNNRTGQATASYNQTSIGYHYPIEFLEATKSLVYDNGEVKIYR
ncbi:hypothetical protein A3F55_03050 [Candidatus Adlerbacteria bacterium RIFCSPHIGHO2_12_FULL_53_18]|uniref:DUF2206 domain-containing protein n=1 Tax=Candidatus Adlerbacteria bacterium RIFCSPHIGHO2_12_FULL_53_18 TaxID=1797242 RepID=A0A1F4XU62_9BACT|nr:MAG: hypothetical protein A3F55_03050 [Candidatus Adlerbacteria bacterium RIFCSPHIGHO2_12_FULL_53_18]